MGFSQSTVCILLSLFVVWPVGVWVYFDLHPLQIMGRGGEQGRRSSVSPSPSLPSLLVLEAIASFVFSFIAPKV